MEKKQIGQLFDTVTRGKSPSYVDDSEVVVINQACIRWDEIDYSKAKYQDPANVKKGTVLQDGDLLITSTGTGTLGRCNVFYAPDDRTYVIDSHVTMMRGTKEIVPEFLKYYMMLDESQGRLYSQCVNGSTNQIELSKEKWSKFVVPVPEISMQKDCVAILQQIDGLMANCDSRIEKMDELIKARFVELFGDPLINSQGLSTSPMTEVCEIIDGDRGKNYPTVDEFADEGYCLFLNAKNVTNTGFNFDTCMFVSKEKDEALRKGKLTRGDVVLTTRGTLGNLAFYTDEIPFEHIRINSGMVILRMKKNIVDEVYFIEQFKMQLADIKAKIASGSAQPQLPISTMNKINILIPDIEKQHQFADFVKQVDKSKVVAQKKRDELRILKQALMQEYFK